MMWKVIRRERLLIAKQLAILIAGISSSIGMYSCLQILNQAGKNQSRLSSWDWLNFFFASEKCFNYASCPYFFVSLREWNKSPSDSGLESSALSASYYPGLIYSNDRIIARALFIFLDSIISVLPWELLMGGV